MELLGYGPLRGKELRQTEEFLDECTIINITTDIKEQDVQEPLFYPDVEPAELGQEMKPRKQKTIRASLKKVDKVQQSKIEEKRPCGVAMLGGTIY